MNRTFFYLFILFIQALQFRVHALVADRPFADSTCPSGTTRVVNYIQRYKQNPFQPDIYTTDCLPSFASSQSNNHTSLDQNPVVPQLTRRQDQSACSTTCGNNPICYDGGTAPSVSDCNELVSYLRNRASTQRVGMYQTVTAVFNTCQFDFVNNIAGPVTWCDTTWASQAAALFSSCIPNRPWALCNLMGVVLQVTGMPPLSTTAGNEATISAPIIQTSSDGRTSTSESTHSTVSSPSTTSAALNSTTSSSSGIASHSNAFSVFLPGTDQTNSGSDDSSGGVGQSSTGEGSRASNTSAVVGGALGSLALLLLISTGIWMWRRNMRRRQRHENVAPGEEQNDGIQQVISPPSLLELSSPQPDPVISRTRPPTSAVLPLSSRPEKRPLESLSSPLLPSNTATPFGTPSGPSTLSLLENNPIPTEIGYQRRGVSILPGSTATISSGSYNSLSLLSIPPNAPPLPQSVDNPELPEDVINRLADTIIARMPLSAVSRPARASRPRLSQLGSDVTSPEQQEEVPPPPWRQSWDSSNHETGD
ncbi:hypothetical protein FRB91_006367 [Serendipita sp. 411]|nr:hypothetical protein FRB91_006367 [Serendipita sp. 411]